MASQAILNSSLQIPNHHRGRVLATACIGVFFSFASVVVYTFGVFLKPLASTFHWSRAQVSLGFTIAALTVAVCSPFIGRLLDRFPARRVVLPCAIVYGLAFGSLAFLTPHLWHFFAIFFVLGVVGNGTAQLAYARVVSAWFDKERGRALAAVMAGSGLGSMVLPPLAQALITGFGWRFTYALLGSGILVCTVPLAALFLHEPKDVVRPVEPTLKVAVGKSVRSAPFLGICTALLLFSFATNGLSTHWLALLTDRGATAQQAAFVLSMAGFAALMGKLFTGYLLDLFRAGRVTAVLLSVCALGFVIILLGHGSWLSILSAVLVGVGMGAESDAVPYLLTRYFGLERFSELYGYTWCVYAVAGATGPAVMGGVFDHTGSYRAILLLSVAFVAAASLIFAVLPRYASSEGAVSPAQNR